MRFISKEFSHLISDFFALTNIFHVKREEIHLLFPLCIMYYDIDFKNCVTNIEFHFNFISEKVLSKF